MELQSQSIVEIIKALLRVQVELKPAKLNMKNPFFNSKYADLQSVFNSCRSLLNANNIVITQSSLPGSMNHTVIVTQLTHDSGEWIRSCLTVPIEKATPQGMGVAFSYGRRYGLSAIVGIVSETDNDGNGQQPQNTQPKQQPQPQNSQPQQNNTAYSPCPNCGQQLRKDKNEERLYCWAARGGCGKNFTMAYDEIVKKDEQPSFESIPNSIPNDPDIPAF